MYIFVLNVLSSKSQRILIGIMPTMPCSELVLLETLHNDLIIWWFFKGADFFGVCQNPIKIWDFGFPVEKSEKISTDFQVDLPTETSSRTHRPNQFRRTSVSASTSTSRAWGRETREISGFDGVSGHNADWTEVSKSGDYKGYKGFIVISTGLRPVN